MALVSVIAVRVAVAVVGVCVCVLLFLQLLLLSLLLLLVVVSGHETGGTRACECTQGWGHHREQHCGRRLACSGI